jgi:hypothetical protein
MELLWEASSDECLIWLQRMPVAVPMVSQEKSVLFDHETPANLPL